MASGRLPGEMFLPSLAAASTWAVVPSVEASTMPPLLVATSVRKPEASSPGIDNVYAPSSCVAAQVSDARLSPIGI